MKVSQTVEMTFDRGYIGYGRLEITDAAGNMVSVKMNRDQTLEMADDFARKKERILKELADEAAELASQTEESANE
jgi:hypothetical protein